MRRKHAFFNERLTKSKPMRKIDFQNGDGRSSDGCNAQQARPFPSKMFVPLMATRMKQTDNSPGARITPRNVWAFMIVAEESGEREIARNGQPVMFARNDVVNLKW